MNEKLKEIIKNMPKDVLINTFKTVYEDNIMKDLEIERLNNIINEVREYIEKNTKEGILKEKKYFYSPEQANDILEILDKASDENE